jgi:hypothetical protein
VIRIIERQIGLENLSFCAWCFALAPMCQFDVTPDGKRFVMTTQRVNPNTPLTLVVNWTALLSKKPWG